MKKYWCSIVLAFFLFGLSTLISMVRDQALAQSLPAGVGPGAVVVSPHPEPPRWMVDFRQVDDPANPVRKIGVITVVDPESKCILVYHQDLSLGTVKLLSTRDMRPDIMIGEFNAVKPTPSEIEAEIRRLRKNPF